MSNRIRRPNVERYAVRRDEKTWDWIKSKVIPYLRTLLDRAQAKLTRHRVTFLDGMGMSNLHIDPPGPHGRSDERLDHAISSAAYATATSFEPVGGRQIRDRDRRYVERFPELVEFMRIVGDLDEYLGQSIGELESSTWETTEV